MTCSRHERRRRQLLLLLLLLALTTLLCNAHGRSDLSTTRAVFWGKIIRGGSTASSNTLDESFLLESFQEQVSKMRRDIQDEIEMMMQQLRKEILEAEEKGLFEEKNVSDDAIIVEEDYDDHHQAEEESNGVIDLDEKETAEDGLLASSKIDTGDLTLDLVEEHLEEEEEEEFLDLLGDTVPPQEEQEKIQLFEDADDFLVGDSDEEPDSVLDRMKVRVKPEDLLYTGEETETTAIVDDTEEFSVQQEEEMISHLAESDADITVESIVIPKTKQRKKKKKKPKQLVAPDNVPKKKKKKKKKEKNKKRPTGKEAVQIALSSKTEGDQVLAWKPSKALVASVKGVILAVLLGLAMLALRLIEMSVTSTTK